MAAIINALRSSGLNFDVDRQVAEVDRALRASGDQIRCTQALATLGHPRFDEMSDDASPRTASAPIWEAERGDWDEV